MWWRGRGCCRGAGVDGLAVGAVGDGVAVSATATIVVVLAHFVTDVVDVVVDVTAVVVCAAAGMAAATAPVDGDGDVGAVAGVAGEWPIWAPSLTAVSRLLFPTRMSLPVSVLALLQLLAMV